MAGLQFLCVCSEKRPVTEEEKEWGLSFLRSPLEIVSSDTDGKAAAVKLKINRLEVRRLVHLLPIFFPWL